MIGGNECELWRNRMISAQIFRKDVAKLFEPEDGDLEQPYVCFPSPNCTRTRSLDAQEVLLCTLNIVEG